MSEPARSGARRGPWTRVVDRIGHKEPATALALFRIACGLGVLYTLIPMVRADVVRVLLTDRPYGGFRPLSPNNWLVDFLGGPTDAAVMILIGLAVMSGLFLVIGLGGRITPLLANQTMIALFAISPGTGGGHDRLHTAALWLLVLAPATATLSLDARLFGDDKAFVSDRPVAAWPRYVAVFQLVLVYCTTGLQKLGQEWMPWGDFSALYYALLAPSWQKWEVAGWLGHPVVYFLTQVGTALTWTWETLAPIWLLAFWFRATHDRPGRLRAWFNRVDVRLWWMLFGVAMHVVLWVMMNLGPFSLVTMSFYLCLFHPDEYASFGRRLRGRFLSKTPVEKGT